MAAIANTYLSTSAVGNLQDIDKVVSRISPEDTPIYTSIEKGTAKNTFTEWEVDELAAPAANVNAEGDEYAFGALTPPERIGNRTQIFRKSGIISGTQEAIDNVGNNEKLVEQKLKKAIEVRKDVELSIVGNTASVDGASRVSGGLASFLETNVSRGAGGANGGYNAGTKLTVAETAGTQRAFTKALLDGVMDAVYQSGGNARSLQLAPKLKTVFASFMSDTNVAQLRSNVPARGSKTVLNGSVDVYQGPNGTVEVVGNRVMAPAGVARRGFILDFDMLEWLWLRKIQEDKDVAKTGDAKKFVMLGEGCLKVKNEAAHGLVADLTVPA